MWNHNNNKENSITATKLFGEKKTKMTADVFMRDTVREFLVGGAACANAKRIFISRQRLLCAHRHIAYDPPPSPSLPNSKASVNNETNELQLK